MSETSQERAIEIFREFAEQATGESVSVGLLPASGGITFRIVTGQTQFISLNRLFRRRKITLDVLSKHKNQSKAYAALCALGNACEASVACGASVACEAQDFALPVIGAQVKAEPNFVGKDGDFWIYSLSVELLISI